MSASVSEERRPPIVQYWHSPIPPGYPAESAKSFSRLNPERPYLLFNARTADAVRTYQRDHGVRATGVVLEDMWSLLKAGTR